MNAVLNEQQLRDFEYSDTYARFKTLAMMKEAGIRGARNGKDANRPGKYIYLFTINLGRMDQCSKDFRDFITND